jgi:hypothetical protein
MNLLQPYASNPLKEAEGRRVTMRRVSFPEKGIAPDLPVPPSLEIRIVVTMNTFGKPNFRDRSIPKKESSDPENRIARS